MANYYKGSVNGLAALQSAIFTACKAEGWTLSGDVLSKGSLYLQVQMQAPYLMFIGATGLAEGGGVNGAIATKPSIAETIMAGSNLPSITWPANYEIFIFAQEVYVVLNYNVDQYQWAAWGKSTVSGLPGSGMWFGASRRNTKQSSWPNWSMTPNSGGDLYGAPALFWSQSTWYNGTGFESYVHSGLEEFGWYPLDSRENNCPGIGPLDPLISMLPNLWNSEAVLVPLRCFQQRSSNKVSLIADLEFARHIRMDNLEPGEIVTLGSDKWKVFPWYRKDAVNRNGGSNIAHSGTFGWAIRYVA